MTNDFKPAKAGGNQPRLSKEEYAEKKRAEKEKVYQMIDDAAREIVSDPEKFKNFLDGDCLTWLLGCDLSFAINNRELLLL